MSKKTCALIGYGNIGHEWAAALKHHPDWELTAIVDANTELLDSIPNMGIGLGENEVFPTIKECVNSGLKPDLAIVAIPPYFHHTVTKEVMDLDINVICEKNMALTLSQGRQMVQLAKSKPNLCTAVDTQYRYQIPYWTAHEFLKQENCPIGKLGMIKWESTDARIDVLKPWWHAFPDIYLSDMSIHWFDLLRYTTGLDIVQVKADVFTPNYSQFQGSSDVSASLALAKLEDYNNRQNWVWCQFYGGFQRNGPTSNEYVYYGEDGQAKIGKYGMELKLYSDKHDKTKFERRWISSLRCRPCNGDSLPRA